MISHLYPWMKDSYHYMRWVISAWTIDHIDSPLIADFYHQVILKSQYHDLHTSERLLVELCNYFDTKQIAIYNMMSDNTQFIETLSSVVSKVWLIKDSFTEVKESDLDFAIVMNETLDHIFTQGVPLAIHKKATLPKAQCSHYNIKIDLWYYKIYWYDSRIKEDIDIKLSPYKKRWKLGISRPLALTS